MGSGKCGKLYKACHKRIIFHSALIFPVQKQGKISVKTLENSYVTGGKNDFSTCLLSQNVKTQRHLCRCGNFFDAFLWKRSNVFPPWRGGKSVEKNIGMIFPRLLENLCTRGKACPAEEKNSSSSIYLEKVLLFKEFSTACRKDCRKSTTQVWKTALKQTIENQIFLHKSSWKS